MVVLRVVLFILAGVCGLGAVFFLLRALGERVQASKKVFGVERQQTLQEMKLHTLIGVGLFVLVLLFSGGAAFTLFSEDNGDAAFEGLPANTLESESLEIPLDETPLLQIEATAAGPTPTLTLPVAAPSTPAPQPTVTESTPTVLPTETLTPTAELVTALVNSPVVGLYLRETPSGEILERLEDQTEVILRGERQVIDDIEWVAVSAPSGNEGWVAVEYLNIVTPEAGSE